MENSARKLFATFAIATMLSVSFIGICKQMVMTCGMDCSQQITGMVHIGTQMDGCAQDGTACSPTAAQNHMAIFSSIYPSVSGEAGIFFLVIGVVFLAAWFLISQTRDVSIYLERLRSRLKDLQKRILNSIAPNYFVLAFSRGILNAKIFA